MKFYWNFRLVDVVGVMGEGIVLYDISCSDSYDQLSSSIEAEGCCCLQESQGEE
jgi:hypothetical protein